MHNQRDMCYLCSSLLSPFGYMDFATYLTLLCVHLFLKRSNKNKAKFN